jgi:hypothetical protein
MDAHSAARVGEGGLCLPEPERGKVWKPAQGFHDDDFRSRRGRPGASPQKPSAAFSNAHFVLGQLGTAPRLVVECKLRVPRP